MKWLPTFKRLQKVCRGCGYPLEELPNNTCPECGRGFDLKKPRTHAWNPKPPKRITIAAIYFCPHLLVSLLVLWIKNKWTWWTISDLMMDTGPTAMLRRNMWRPLEDMRSNYLLWFVVQWALLLLVVSWTHWRYVPIKRHILYSLVWLGFWFLFARLPWIFRNLLF